MKRPDTILGIGLTNTARPERGPADHLLAEIQEDVLSRHPDWRQRLNDQLTNPAPRPPQDADLDDEARDHRRRERAAYMRTYRAQHPRRRRRP